MKRALQVSDSIELGIILALSGGFMDAYSYIQRGNVFANAQTGNMLLFGIHLSEGDLKLAVSYFFPVLAFAIGIAISDMVHRKDMNTFHWRQIAVLFEAIVLAAVSFMPLSMNLLANSLTSLACGIQVQSFRKIHGYGIATTMCIGNLRNATQNIDDYLKTKNKKFLHKGILYYLIILSFIIGAVIGNIVIKYLHEKAILACSIMLAISFAFMFVDRESKITLAEEEQ